MTQYDLTDDEREIIDTYRSVNAAGKKHLRMTVEAVRGYAPFSMHGLRIVKKTGNDDKSDISFCNTSFSETKQKHNM